MKRIYHLMVIGLCLSAALGLTRPCFGGSDASRATEQDQEIAFLWAFGALEQKGQGHQFKLVDRKTELKSGDQFKLFLEPRTRSFFYVIMKSSQGEIALLYPQDLKGEYAPLEVSTSLMIPPQDLWFVLDERKGQEFIYLLASTQRLEKLEDLLGEYAGEGEKRDETMKQLLGEIRRLKKQHRSFKVAAERPERIAGRVRGELNLARVPDMELRTHAIELSAESFFSRTFTIEHK